jgi:hypothetical protein
MKPEIASRARDAEQFAELAHRSIFLLSSNDKLYSQVHYSLAFPGHMLSSLAEKDIPETVKDVLITNCKVSYDTVQTSPARIAEGNGRGSV